MSTGNTPTYPDSLPCTLKQVFPYQQPIRTYIKTIWVAHQANPKLLSKRHLLWSLPANAALWLLKLLKVDFKGATASPTKQDRRMDPLLPFCLYNVPGTISLIPWERAPWLQGVFVTPWTSLHLRRPLQSPGAFTLSCQKMPCFPWPHALSITKKARSAEVNRVAAATVFSGHAQLSLNSKWLATGPACNDVAVQGPRSRGGWERAFTAATQESAQARVFLPN